MDRFSELRDAVLPILKPYGLKRLAVFGSYARGDETPNSDIDLLVEFEDPPRKKLSLLDWVGLELEIEGRLGRKVDMVTFSGLKPRIKPYVGKDVRLLYEER